MNSISPLKRNKVAYKTGRNFLRPVFFFVLGCLLLHESSSFADVATDLNKQGMEMLREGKYTEAIVYLESAHASDPYNEEIWHNLSFAYHKLALKHSSKKDWPNAISNEKQALRYNKESSIIKEQLGIFYNNYALEYVDKDRYDLAIDNLKEAIKQDPNSSTIRTNLYNVMIREAEGVLKNKNEFKAKSLAKDAIDFLPERADAYIFLGNIYYSTNNFKDAESNWKKALQIQPNNKELAKLMEKLKREKRVEEHFKTRRRQHFTIHFDKELGTDYAWEISDILDDARRATRSKFNFAADEIISVVVYSKDQFRNATNAIHWTQGIYDGKVRITEQDISREDTALRRILYHEHAHAVLNILYGANIPIWLHEGFAQYNEPEYGFREHDKSFLRSYIKSRGDFSLESLEPMFAKKNDHDTLRAAYLYARLFFHHLVDEYRIYKSKRLFEELKSGKRWQEALISVYNRSIERFNGDFSRHLNELLN